MRSFGATDLKVGVLGFGSSEIGFLGATPDDVEILLNEALDAGLNVIDTAECYMDAEEKIGRAVSHRRSEYALFTKLGHGFLGGPELEDWSPGLLRLSIENSLRQLRTDCVDLLQIHSCDAEVLRRGDVLAVVQEAKRTGKTRYIGYSGDGEEALEAIQTGVFDALQTSVNIADQEAIDLLLPEAVSRNLGVVVKRPVANVAWHGGTMPPARQYGRVYWERLMALRYPFLEPDTGSGFETALRFTLAQPGVSTMIVGTMRPGRWRENQAIVARGPLPSADVEAIRTRWREVATPRWVGQT